MDDSEEDRPQDYRSRLANPFLRDTSQTSNLFQKPNWPRNPFLSESSFSFDSKPKSGKIFQNPFKKSNLNQLNRSSIQLGLHQTSHPSHPNTQKKNIITNSNVNPFQRKPKIIKECSPSRRHTSFGTEPSSNPFLNCDQTFSQYVQNKKHDSRPAELAKLRNLLYSLAMRVCQLEENQHTCTCKPADVEHLHSCIEQLTAEVTLLQMQSCRLANENQWLRSRQAYGQRQEEQARGGNSEGQKVRKYRFNSSPSPEKQKLKQTGPQKEDMKSAENGKEVVGDNSGNGKDKWASEQQRHAANRQIENIHSGAQMQNQSILQSHESNQILSLEEETQPKNQPQPVLPLVQKKQIEKQQIQMQPSQCQFSQQSLWHFL